MTPASRKAGERRSEPNRRRTSTMTGPQHLAAHEGIEAVTIPASRATPLIALFVGPLAAALASGALATWWVTGLNAPVNALLALPVGVPLGLAVTGWAIRELLFPCRIVLGQKALQVVSGRDRVLMHIPYR